MGDWTGKIRVLMLKPPDRRKGSYTYATVRV